MQVDLGDGEPLASELRLFRQARYFLARDECYCQMQHGMIRHRLTQKPHSPDFQQTAQARYRSGDEAVIADGYLYLIIGYQHRAPTD